MREGLQLRGKQLIGYEPAAPLQVYDVAIPDVAFSVDAAVDLKKRIHPVDSSDKLFMTVQSLTMKMYPLMRPEHISL